MENIRKWTENNHFNRKKSRIHCSHHSKYSSLHDLICFLLYNRGCRCLYHCQCYAVQERHYKVKQKISLSTTIERLSFILNMDRQMIRARSTPVLPYRNFLHILIRSIHLMGSIPIPANWLRNKKLYFWINTAIWFQRWNRMAVFVF